MFDSFRAFLASLDRLKIALIAVSGVLLIGLIVVLVLYLTKACPGSLGGGDAAAAPDPDPMLGRSLYFYRPSRGFFIGAIAHIDDFHQFNDRMASDNYWAALKRGSRYMLYVAPTRDSSAAAATTQARCAVLGIGDNGAVTRKVFATNTPNEVASSPDYRCWLALEAVSANGSDGSASLGNAGGGTADYKQYRVMSASKTPDGAGALGQDEITEQYVYLVTATR